MAKKKTTKKKTAKKKEQPEQSENNALDVTGMGIYECRGLIMQLEDMAKANDGELTDEQLQSFVEAQTQSMVQLSKLVGVINFFEQGIDYCKKEEKRIAENRRKAEKRLGSIKNYLTPYVKEQGKINVGTFTLSTRKSTSVFVPDGYNDPFFCKVNSIKNPSPDTVAAARAKGDDIVISPDKKAIGDALKGGNEVPGCELAEKDNLQIK